MQNIVADNEETAKKCVEMLKKSHGGRATFLPLTSVKGEVMKNAPKNEKGYIGIASELIEYDEKYRGIFAYLLGRTVFADDIDSGIAISRKYGYKFKVVTLDGQVLNAGGSITGGSSDSRLGLISRAKTSNSLKPKPTRWRKRLTKTTVRLQKTSRKSAKLPLKKKNLTQKVQIANTILSVLMRKNRILTKT